MAILQADKKYVANGVTVNVYHLGDHNDNDIDMPPRPRCLNLIGITIHNTDWISVASGTTPAEQYTRATKNGNMGSVRVHYYVDDECAWENLPHDQGGWHSCDGNVGGNGSTIAIECIMKSSNDPVSLKSEENCARLTAYLLQKYGFTIDDVYTHNDWYKPKYCPIYILPHWNSFLDKVRKYLGNPSAPSEVDVKELYRVRKEWNDAKSQLGAYSVLDNAIKCCQDGYGVYDKNGKIVYKKESGKPVELVNVPEQNDILELQKILNNKGYHLVEDGIFGNKTYDVVSDYTIEYSDRGELTRWVQQRLTNKGYPCGEIDGICGSKTMGAIAKFQEDNGLGVGYLGGTDWKYLCK